MVMTASAARTISSVHGLRYSPEMSMPISAIAAIAAGFTALVGSEPPDQASARPPARCWNQPRAIWLRPALCTQRKRTTGTPPSSLPSTRASAWSRWRANRSARIGTKLIVVACSANWSQLLTTNRSMVSSPNTPWNSSARRATAKRRASCWSTVGPVWVMSAPRLPGSEALVGDDDGIGGEPRVQEPGDGDRRQPSRDLDDDERRRARRADAGEGSGERPPDRHRGVREAGGRREPVRGGDVGPDGERRDRRSTRPNHAEDQDEGGNELGEPQRPRRPRVRRERDRGQVEHEVRDDRSNARPHDLGEDVIRPVAGGNPTEDAVSERDDRVEMPTRDRAQGQDQRDETGSGHGGVDQQLEPDVAR